MLCDQYYILGDFAKCLSYFMDELSVHRKVVIWCPIQVCLKPSIVIRKIKTFTNNIAIYTCIHVAIRAYTLLQLVYMYPKIFTKRWILGLVLMAEFVLPYREVYTSIFVHAAISSNIQSQKLKSNSIFIN